ncbi:hypothetical protein A9Q84_00970 [Halobacteriovorax marinus]|uniref:Uncharacterized protein n=1 Tax=Halobacteriovorax marinus TaxID=97084 RepID=A0A1Y5FBW3_9BACT|nr:hypothetical protein A9Q84_00970 [Halobacteriovorax marinus]
MRNMKVFKLFLVLILLFVGQPAFGGQKLKATWSGAKNLLLSPIDLFSGGKNWVTGNNWDSYVEKEENMSKDSEGRSGESVCASITKEELDSLENSLAKVGDKLCKCVAWANCPQSKTCTCEMLCPDGLAIFDHADNTSMNTNMDSNSFGFRNSGSAFVFSEEGMTAGYCWGHASATTKFNRLAKFRPNEEVPCIKKKSCKRGDEDYLEYMEDLIDDIMNNKPRVIPGYKNLKEFSSKRDQSDSVLLYLGKTVSNEWSDQAMSFQGLGAVSSQNVVSGVGRKTMSKKSTASFAKDVQEKLKYGLQPQLVITAKGKGSVTHVVLASKVYQEGDKTIICIRDNNSSTRDNSFNSSKKCGKSQQMTIDKDGKTTYPKMTDMTNEYIEVDLDDKEATAGKTIYTSRDGSTHYTKKEGSPEVAKMTIAHNVDSDTIKQLHNLRENCQKELGCDD